MSQCSVCCVERVNDGTKHSKNKVLFFYLSVKRECAKDVSTKTSTTYNADQKLHNMNQTSFKRQSIENNFNVSMELCLKH